MRPITVVSSGMYGYRGTWAAEVATMALAMADDAAYLETLRVSGAAVADFLATRARHNRVAQCRFAMPDLREALAEGIVHKVIFSGRDPMTALADCLSPGEDRSPAEFASAMRRVAFSAEQAMQLRDMPQAMVFDVDRDDPAETVLRILDHLEVELAPAAHSALLHEAVSRATPDGVPDWTTSLTVEQIAQSCVVFAPYTVTLHPHVDTHLDAHDGSQLDTHVDTHGDALVDTHIDTRTITELPAGV